jgi:hypothetical protein
VLLVQTVRLCKGFLPEAEAKCSTRDEKVLPSNHLFFLSSIFFFSLKLSSRHQHHHLPANYPFRMSFSFTYSSLRTFIFLFLITSSHALFQPSVMVSSTQSVQKAILQQNLDISPPFPILEVATAHILSQIGANATRAENDSMAEMNLQRLHTKSTILQGRDSAAQCGPGLPCSDGSCCNSVSTYHLKKWHALLTVIP